MNEETSHPVPFDVPWRTGVLLEDLAAIDGLRSQGKSLGASVSMVILKEMRELREEVRQLFLRVQPMDLKRYSDLLEGVQAYGEPADVLLYGEEVIRSGEPPISMEDLQHRVAQGLEWTYGELEEDELDEFQPQIASSAANWYLFLRGLGKSLEKMTPLELVDSYTEESLKVMSEDQLLDEGTRSLIEEGLKKVTKDCMIFMMPLNKSFKI